MKTRSLKHSAEEVIELSTVPKYTDVIHSIQIILTTLNNDTFGTWDY
jgi:hypothetical protein